MKEVQVWPIAVWQLLAKYAEKQKCGAGPEIENPVVHEERRGWSAKCRWSDLGETAVDEKFGAIDVARRVGGEEHCHLADFARIGEPAERDASG